MFLVVGRDAVAPDVRRGLGAGVVAPHLEPLAVAAGQAVAEGNAGVEQHRTGRAPAIEAIVGVVPGTAPPEDIARADVVNDAEAVGVAAIA